MEVYQGVGVVEMVWLWCRQEQNIHDSKNQCVKMEDRLIILDCIKIMFNVWFIVIDDYLYLVLNNDALNLQNFALPEEFKTLVQKYKNW